MVELIRRSMFLMCCVIAASLVGCTSDEREDVLPITPEQDLAKTIEPYGGHLSGDFIGQFYVSYYDGSAEIGQGSINTDGWFTFDYLPGNYLIKQVMPAGEEYTINEAHRWGGERFGYKSGSVSGVNQTFCLSLIEGIATGVRYSGITGTYHGKEAFFTGIYDESTILYNSASDQWSGEIRFKGILVLSDKGEELGRIEVTPSYALSFRSSGRKI